MVPPPSILHGCLEDGAVSGVTSRGRPRRVGETAKAQCVLEDETEILKAL